MYVCRSHFKVPKVYVGILFYDDIQNYWRFICPKAISFLQPS